MIIRIDGKTEIGNATVRVMDGGGLLTITIRNSTMAVGDIAVLLDGRPKIEVISGGFVTAVYQGMRLRSCRMEIIGGVTTATVSLQVDRLSADTATAIEQALKLQEATIREQEETIEAIRETARNQEERIEEQAQTILAQSDAIEEQKQTIANQAETIRTQGDKLTTQEKSLAQMKLSVQEAERTAAYAADALAAIEEGIADV